MDSGDEQSTSSRSGASDEVQRDERDQDQSGLSVLASDRNGRARRRRRLLKEMKTDPKFVGLAESEGGWT